MKVLETERLILRPFKLEDLDDFYDYAKEEGVGEFAGWPTHKSKEESLNILKMFIEGTNGDQEFALELKETNKLVGSLGVHNRSMDPDYPGNKHLEIGYVLRKDQWGKGLMTEAVLCAIDYCFDDLEVDVLWCGHFTHNDRSRRVVEKCGFKYHKDAIYDAKLLNKSFPEKCYLITREEYYKNK